jgi:predicted nucleic acid-binding protein
VTRPFFDTNVLIYLLTEDQPKADRVGALLKDGGVISVQVLNEFARVATHKFRTPWGPVREVLRAFRANLSVEPLTIETHDLGLVIAERHQVALFDGMIIAAARLAQCDVLYSEDMHAGWKIGDLTIRNPFQAR